MLKKGDVDIVVRTMSITCDRLQDVDFSAVYYEAGQQVLVRQELRRQGPRPTSAGRRCARTDGVHLAHQHRQGTPAKPIGGGRWPDWTDCLVMLQQGQVDAVSTDDTILAGLAAQDPYTEVVGARVRQRAVRHGDAQGATPTSSGS